MKKREPKLRVKGYTGPAGGYGSLRSVARILTQEEVPQRAATTLNKQNKADGYMCVSCSWGKPVEPHPFEYCENGAKATAWETTKRRVKPHFFAKHTLTELEDWPDHDLEEAGRLTTPMRWNASSDRYEPVGWDEACAETGRELIARSKRLAWPKVEAAVADACAGASGTLLEQLSALEEALAAAPLHVRAARVPARGRKYA